MKSKCGGTHLPLRVELFFTMSLPSARCKTAAKN